MLDHIWRRSEGNPLFVEELLAAGEAADPRSVIDVLLARVARLDPGAMALVEAAAVAGRPVDDRLLAEVLDVPETEIDDRLRMALDHRVLRLEPITGAFRFRHELLREVVEAGLLPGSRRRLHERFARCLEARPDLADTSPVGAAADLAHHFAEAGLVVEAYSHSIRAAGESETVHAYADAHRHLERALALEPHLPPGADDELGRLSLRRRAADDADLGGDPARAMELTRAALAMVDPSADPVTAGLLQSRVGYLQWSLGDGATALEAHREAVRLVPPDPPTAERARVLASLGGALMGAGHWAESREICEAAIACAVAADARAEESRARNMLGSDLVALGAIDDGIAQLREACRLAEQTGPADTLIVGYYNLALNLATADRLDEALLAAEAGRVAAPEAGLERRYGQDLAALAGDILLRLGRVDAALDVLSEGLALAPGGIGTIYLSTVRARIAGIRGDDAEFERRLGTIELEGLDPGRCRVRRRGQGGGTRLVRPPRGGPGGGRGRAPPARRPRGCPVDRATRGTRASRGRRARGVGPGPPLGDRSRGCDRRHRSAARAARLARATRHDDERARLGRERPWRAGKGGGQGWSPGLARSGRGLRCGARPDRRRLRPLPGGRGRTSQRGRARRRRGPGPRGGRGRRTMPAPGRSPQPSRRWPRAPESRPGAR